VATILVKKQQKRLHLFYLIMELNCLLAAITYTNSWYGNNCEWTGYRTSTLKLLNLSGAGIQSEGGDYIAAVICRNTALHYLIVDNNDLKAVGISKDHKSFVTQCNSTDRI